MPTSITINDRQHVGAGISILDQDGQPFVDLPSGITVQFASDNPAVADFTVAADGMNIDVTSGQVGNAIITATVNGLPSGALTDTLAVAVQNSLPGSANFTVGQPIDE